MKNIRISLFLALFAAPAGWSEGTAQSPSPHFGCQARTFGEGIYKDEAAFLNVVRQIGQIGFEGLETNWKNLERYFDQPERFVRILNEAHLKLIAAHMGGSPWNMKALPKLREDVARTAEFVKKVGGRYVVFSGAAPKTKPLPPDTWQQLAHFMNEIGSLCAAHGIRCLYHNHWWDCEGQGLETLCRLTDPKLVGFALDTGHVLHAGKDPAALIGLMGRRLGVVHLSDFVPGDSGGKRPPLGEGELKIPAIVAALRQAGFDQWLVLEEETPGGNGRALAEKGLAVFRKAFPREL